MPKYDWSRRHEIEPRPANYVVCRKITGSPVYDGIALSARHRLAYHTQFVPGTFVVVTYRRRGITPRRLAMEETERLRRARSPRKNIQKNPMAQRLCAAPLCEHRVEFPNRRCADHGLD